MRVLLRVLGVFVVLLIGASATATTADQAAAFSYDLSSAARVDPYETGAVDAGPTWLSGIREKPDSPAAEGATPGARSVATEAVSTPFGPAAQGADVASVAARSQVEGGATLYRTGTLGKSAASEGQSWSLEHPSTAGYGSRYGLPAENVANADFIESATLRPGSPFIMRTAPGIGKNVGGGIEAVVQPGGVTMCGFSYLGSKAC